MKKTDLPTIHISIDDLGILINSCERMFKFFEDTKFRKKVTRDELLQTVDATQEVIFQLCSEVVALNIMINTMQRPTKKTSKAKTTSKKKH